MGKRTFWTQIAFVSVAISATFAAKVCEANAPIALVYKGKGSCDGNACSKSAAKIARAAGYTVRYVEAWQMTQDATFRGAQVWIQPGGNAIDAAEDIGTEGLEILASRIANGLHYVGICAGAFLADRTVDDPETIGGLGLIEFSTYDYPAEEGPQILPIYWGGARRYMYFEGGPAFRVSPHEYAYYGIEEIGTYQGGELAVFRSAYGRGKVVLSAPHPEASEDWLEADELEDPDGLDFDLALELLHLSSG